MQWRDLSDDELAARLAHRAPDSTDETAHQVARLVRFRDDPEVAAILDRLLQR